MQYGPLIYFCTERFANLGTRQRDVVAATQRQSNQAAGHQGMSFKVLLLRPARPRVSVGCRGKVPTRNDDGAKDDRLQRDDWRGATAARVAKFRTLMPTPATETKSTDGTALAVLRTPKLGTPEFQTRPEHGLPLL